MTETSPPLTGGVLVELVKILGLSGFLTDVALVDPPAALLPFGSMEELLSSPGALRTLVSPCNRLLEDLVGSCSSSETTLLSRVLLLPKVSLAKEFTEVERRVWRLSGIRLPLGSGSCPRLEEEPCLSVNGS
mmetsp:Transcript_67701/g.201337  ORF Transcript_67701/g.201337 Transcript_67701/m.201337 type:complete len:132 (-) Transcript_67701:740-1135(-)